MNEYEKSLNKNSILAWVHSLRYQKTIEFFDMIDWKRPIRVLEIGCANAKLFEILNERFNIEYVGIEPYGGFYREAFETYKTFPNFSIVQEDASLIESYASIMRDVDVVICLETIEHMPLAKALRILARVETLNPKFFICSFPIEVGPSVWIKNLASFIFGYHRHKKTYSWKETFWAGLYRLDKLPAHTSEHKGFDWRIIVKEIKNRMCVLEVSKFPFNLPSFIANSVYTISTPKESRR